MKRKTNFCSNPNCQKGFNPSDFDRLDLEFDEEKPLCPKCAQESELTGETCENHDDRPARHWHGSEMLCDECFEEVFEHSLD